MKSCFTARPPTLTNERWLHTQTVIPEIWAAVRHGAVAEQIAVADSVQVRHCALVVSARAAASSPLAVGAKWVSNTTNMEWTGQVPLGPPGQDSVCSTLSHHQEQHGNGQKRQLHDESVKNRTVHLDKDDSTQDTP